jgi:hypothetical protein
VNGLKTAYGSSSANAADNGLGHPVVLSVNRVQRIYELNPANGHIDSDQLVVHTPHPSEDGSLSSLPDLGYVSPLASGGYPALDATALSTSGLQNPDAFMGAVAMGRTTTVVYVEKTLNADTGLVRLPCMPENARFRADQPGQRQTAQREPRCDCRPRGHHNGRHQFHRCRRRQRPQ